MDGLDLTAAEIELARQVAEHPKVNYPAMTQLKRLLAARLGPELGFARWRGLIAQEKFPDADRVEARRLCSLRAAAENASVRVDVAPSGRPFEILSPKVIGDGDHRTLRNNSRALYVTCLSDARVRSGSALIDADGAAMLDFEDSEVAKVHQAIGFRSSDVDIDPSVFYCDTEKWLAWTLVPAKEHGEFELESAYSLFGVTARQFGHWMSEYLPKYIMASMTGSLPPVPILINKSMPKTHRQALELLAHDGVEIVEWPRFATVYVRKLWLSSKCNFPPIFKDLRWDYFAPDPAAVAPVWEEMARRLDRAVPLGRGPDKVYLARNVRLHRKLINAAAIEEIAQEAGFMITYPEDLSFAEQFRLVRDARFVLGPEGSAIFLCMLSRPETKVGILNHTHTENVVITAGLLNAISIDVTVVTGPVVSRNKAFPHFSDYEIDVGRFRSFLADWLHQNSTQATTVRSAAH